MTVADRIELDTLTAPISDEAPTGVDLRLDPSPNSIYYKVKDARNAARANERAAIGIDDRDAMGKVDEEWHNIIELAPTVLKDHAKDLEIVAWYIEALVRTDGFAGMREGFNLTRELVERYWDNIFPMPDEDGMETRIAPIMGLNGVDGEGTLLAPIRNIALTQGFSGTDYAQWQYVQAQELERITDPDKRKSRIEAGVPTMAQIERAAMETPLSFYETLIADIDSCLAAFQLMNEAFDKAAGADAPPSSNIKNAIIEVKSIVSYLTRDMFIDEAAGESESSSESGGGDVAVKSKSGGSLNGEVATRDEALKMLQKIAEFFKRTEPHSPVSYSLEQAIRWSRMTLPDLLEQLIPDGKARQEYFRLAGVRPSSEEGAKSTASSSSSEFF
ncbi:MAG: type VI secretion system protein TssA [Gammaproteobacteria bacterium]|nr:type VI secretion system protein TssA [Gammaproteobacteria bacterium]